MSILFRFMMPFMSRSRYPYRGCNRLSVGTDIAGRAAGTLKSVRVFKIPASLPVELRLLDGSLEVLRRADVGGEHR
jgi:hypothetical protein